MKGFLKRLRGALGVGLTWGAVWAAIFATLGLIIGIVDPDSIDPGEGPIRTAAIGSVFGFVSGAVFSILLSVVEGRKNLRDLSLWRVGLWGALATAVYPLLTPVDNSIVLIFSPVGGAIAAGLVAIAKRTAPATPAEQNT